MIESYKKLREGVKRVVETLYYWEDDLKYKFDVITPDRLPYCKLRLNEDEVVVEQFIAGWDFVDEVLTIRIKIPWLSLSEWDLIKEFTKEAEAKIEAERLKKIEAKRRKYEEAKREVERYEITLKLQEKLRWLDELGVDHPSLEESKVIYRDSEVCLRTDEKEYTLPHTLLVLGKEAFKSFIEDFGS